MPTFIAPRVQDLGGFSVRRLLPAAAARSVGPFVFLDEMGPHAFPAGTGIDVRPHPHIGLATVTYLWEGAILHRDSLGNALEIRPGDVNWMTAGRGIVHSERTPPQLRASGHRLHGLQTWVALPEDLEETAPDFAHHPAASLPQLERDGARLTVVAGQAFGARSPVAVHSDTLYVAIDLAAGARLSLPAEHAERAVYPVAGTLSLDGAPLPVGHLAVLQPGTEPVLAAGSDARLMLLGGAPLGPRRMWWNFVSSRAERIEQAKQDWSEGRFAPVPGEQEWIPLPER